MDNNNISIYYCIFIIVILIKYKVRSQYAYICYELIGGIISIIRKAVRRLIA